MMFLSRASKKEKWVFVSISSVLLLAGVFLLTWSKNPAYPDSGVCTADAKLCSDGSYVGRSGPDCEFTTCPEKETEYSSTFGNEHVEKSIAMYLVEQDAFIQKTASGGFDVCAIENLDPTNELFPVYVWAYCGEYTFQNGEMKNVSGSSVPVKVNYPNELSFYQMDRFSYEVPGDGSQYAKDVERIFPEKLREKIVNFNVTNIAQRAEALARKRMSDWDAIVRAIRDCEVKSIFQAHSREVRIELKNGESVQTVEPGIDDVFSLVKESKNTCGDDIVMATE